MDSTGSVQACAVELITYSLQGCPDDENRTELDTSHLPETAKEAREKLGRVIGSLMATPCDQGKGI